MSGEEWAQIYFEDVRVPPEMVVLKEGGFKKQIAGFNVERIGNTSRSLALGRYAYETRARMGDAAQAVRAPAVRVPGSAVEVRRHEDEARRGTAAPLSRGGERRRGFPSAEETAIAKAFCNQAGFDVANEALQVMGGLGYSQEALVEYCVRRCRGWMIAGGSIEILKNRIAESVFERTFSQRPG